ncbi:aminotransferase class III-fold pyridoxal phosphate-dependent enzyme [Rhodococcus sp. SBT000017]|nr:aminotransferase class III-fold pyridoxal phosphate-dependent enzyme [Rhodococcus sp. SBT000017]
MLSEFGLALKYVRAEGNTLYYLADDGTHVGVFDAASGFGSLMFGHNNPVLVEHAKWLLDQQTPIHAQFSGYSYATNLAEKLNDIVRRELRTDEKYFCLFGNSGAEAVEITIKHAELDRGMRIKDLKTGIDNNVEVARRAVMNGADITAAAERLDVDANLESLVSELQRRNLETELRPPLFLALEGGFHGKLVSSVQLTFNEEFRGPFKALAAQARFVPRSQPEVIDKILEEERASLLDLVVQDGELAVVERAFPVFAAFLIEPILGEAGIFPISEELARAVRLACDRTGVPLVSDEIQSGMGRSGTFLAGTHIDLRPDYIILAKALGGGIAKLGVVLVNENRYRKEFELMHTSTFGRDGFSSRIALKFLQMLEADGGKAYKMAAERGLEAKSMFLKIKDDYPDVVKDVRGEGLILGFELRDQSSSESAEIRESVRFEALPFVIGGHLLRKHKIRIFSTASNLDTLRFEPSIFLSQDEIAQVDVGFRDVCDILRAQDASRFA